jgi:hypothetical protein
MEKSYTYRINFVDGYYYYGKRLLKRNNPLTDGYYGTPITHKEKWCTTMFWKEIINEYDDWIECSKSEIELIRPVLNDPMCLNENCGGYSSLKILKENGKRAGTIQPLEVKRANGYKARDQKLGMFAMSPEERTEVSKQAGLDQLERKVGIHTQSIEDRKRMGEYCRDNKIGFHSWSREQYEEHGKKLRDEGKGIFGLSKEQKSEMTKKISKIRNAQRWQCTVTGHISNPTGLSKYQNNRNINTKNRIKIV